MGDLNLDVSAEEARALHRVVRAMLDGHCPYCGDLRDSRGMHGCLYRRRDGTITNFGSSKDDWLGEGMFCRNCRFHITAKEAKAALSEFHKYMAKSVAVFQKWRNNAFPSAEECELAGSRGLELLAGGDAE